MMEEGKCPICSDKILKIPTLAKHIKEKHLESPQNLVDYGFEFIQSPQELNDELVTENNDEYLEPNFNFGGNFLMIV